MAWENYTKPKMTMANMVINMDKVIEFGADNPKAAKLCEKSKINCFKKHW